MTNSVLKNMSLKQTIFITHFHQHLAIYVLLERNFVVCV